MGGGQLCLSLLALGDVVIYSRHPKWFAGGVALHTGDSLDVTQLAARPDNPELGIEVLFVLQGHADLLVAAHLVILVQARLPG